MGILCVGRFWVEVEEWRRDLVAMETAIRKAPDKTACESETLGFPPRF